jgi:hypothetical protein
MREGVTRYSLKWILFRRQKTEGSQDDLTYHAIGAPLLLMPLREEA